MSQISRSVDSIGGSDLALTLVAGETLTIGQYATFENFVGQFQNLCHKLLCVIDGTHLRYYTKRQELPTGIRFAFKRRHGKTMEYYFIEPKFPENPADSTTTQYCVFGRDCAKIFYPRLEEVDPISTARAEVIREDLPREKIERAPPNLAAYINTSKPPEISRPPIIQPLSPAQPEARISTTIVDRVSNTARTWKQPDSPVLIKIYVPM